MRFTSRSRLWSRRTVGLNTVSCDHRRLDDSTIVDSKEVAPRVILNYDARDQVVGIKLLRLSKRTPRLDSASCASRPPERW